MFLPQFRAVRIVTVGGLDTHIDLVSANLLRECPSNPNVLSTDERGLSHPLNDTLAS
jgi:hypothetical protein